MYEEALAQMEQPAYIKANLPLAYVAEKYGVRLISDGQRLSGICPFHPDTTPSFDIYPWGDAERYGCFACGAAGDVLDFMQRMSGIGFREAVEAGLRGITRCVEEGWTAPALGAVFEWDAQAAKELLWRGEMAGVAELIANKGWLFTAEWAKASWGLAAVGQEVLFPIYDEHRGLVGMKHRPCSGARSLISLPGSRLRSTLYGAHRGAQGTVLLVEGESDALTASWLLRERPVAVLGLPAGAGAAPTRLDLLEGRSVLICLDGDEAGRLSAARWFSALDSSCIRPVDIIDLPDGQDITSLSAKDPNYLTSKLVGQP